MAHRRGGRLRVAPDLRGADERKRLFAHGPDEVAIPLLALLADVDRVQKVRAGMPDVRVAQRAEVRDRDALDRRLLQEQETDGRVGGPGEALELLQRGSGLAALPGLKVRECRVSVPTLKPARSRAQRNISGRTSTRIMRVVSARSVR